jgi:hypothetical protein
MPAANRTANGCSCAGTEQAAAHRALPRVVRVRTTSQPQHEGRRNNGRSDQSIHHAFLS